MSFVSTFIINIDLTNIVIGFQNLREQHSYLYDWQTLNYLTVFFFKSENKNEEKLWEKLIKH